MAQTLRTLKYTVLASTAAFLLTGSGLVAQNTTPSETSPSAQSQPASKSDTAMTSKIRRALMKDKTLSVSAQNVDVITRDGRVTLKGEVDSDTQKQAVEAKATEIAGTGNVDNQITVKGSDSPKGQ